MTSRWWIGFGRGHFRERKGTEGPKGDGGSVAGGVGAHRMAASMAANGW
jgi:hypothetical protein